MRTYGSIFAIRDFKALLAYASLVDAAQAISGLALSTLVLAQTGSPLLSAIALFGSAFAQLIGAATLLSSADRVRPRSALTIVGAIFVVATLVMTVNGLPAWVLLLIQLSTGVSNAVASGVQGGLVNEIAPGGGYILGRSLLSMSNGLLQGVGFAVGGALLALTSPRGALLVASVLYALATAVAAVALTSRAPRVAGLPSISLTWTANKKLLSTGPRRILYLAMWVPNGLVVGCVALFVAYSPKAAGVLFSAEALGMLVGNAIVGWLLSDVWRDRLLTPLRIVLAMPYILFALHPTVVVALVAVTAASAGYSATLVLQQRLIFLTPIDIQGQALGLSTSGMLAMQGVAAMIAGVVSGKTSPAIAIAIMAAASLLVSLALTPWLPRSSSGEASAHTG